MHQSDYCMQTSVLKLGDTKNVQIWQLLFFTCYCFFWGLFSCQEFSSKAAPQSAAQIKDHTAMGKLDR